jgi:tight adherence protein C
MIETLLTFIVDLFGADTDAMQFLAVAAAIVGVGMIIWHIKGRRNSVQRRILDGTPSDARRAAGAGKGPVVAKPILDDLVNSLEAGMGEGEDQKRVLRVQLIQAGFFDKRAIAYFFGIRILAGLVFGFAMLIGFFVFGDGVDSPANLAFVFVAIGLGYVTPVIVLDRIIQRKHYEHSQGFPDVMDLMVVCSQAGLSMEAGIQRIAMEISEAFPSLGKHMSLTALEIRNGKTLSKSIEALGKRLGIAEATSFATLLQQSEELGSSLTNSLRAYSDDMRNKRLMKAEEKAYSLPAKLVVPLTLFVFPVLLVVLLLPIVISVSVSSL